MIAAQDRIEVTAFRRANNWKPEVSNRLEDTVNLKSIGLSLQVASIYEAWQSAPRAEIVQAEAPLVISCYLMTLVYPVVV